MRKRQLILILIATTLASCSSLGSTRLAPDYPPHEREKWGLWGQFTDVATPRPDLRWQPLQLSNDTQDEDDPLRDVTDIRYELRIWETANGFSGNLVYARDGIAETHHTIQQPLKIGARYLWTVRAKYVLQDRQYYSDWSLSSSLMENKTVPNPACFRFTVVAKPANN